MKFRSKIDTWLAALMLLSVGVIVFATYSVIATGAGAVLLGPVTVVGMGAGIVLPLWILTSTYYVVDDGNLLVRSGPFRWRVPLAEITRVAPTRSAMSGPALSLDRLLVEYGAGKAVMVSPRDQEAFTRAIGKANGVARPAR